jgi:1-phosphatidylinositol-4-phosphate 5-kinase
MVHYLGIVDMLTPSGVVKRVEYLWKGMSADRVRVLAFVYAHRF